MSDTQSGFRPDRSFRTAYAVALGACLVTSWLTHVYVGAGATELNPVVRWSLAAVGHPATTLARALVLILAYWCYLGLWLAGASRSLVVGFAWLGAAVHVLDAAHDLRQALLAGVLPPFDPWSVTVPVLLAGLLGGLLHPASPPARHTTRFWTSR